MTAPVDASGSAQVADPEAVTAGVGRDVEGRSLGQIAWMRLKRDKVALAAAAVVLLLILVAIFAPLITAVYGHGPNDFHPEKIDRSTTLPKGSLGGIDGDFWLGAEPGTGRDVFSRVVYGARVSLLIAVAATGVALVIGVTLGIAAGYFGGWVDAVVSRVMDVLLAFPLLLFAIALIGIISDTTPRIPILVGIIGFFSWPYMGRIVRGQTLSLREREFVDAARALGASDGHILFRQLLPNLIAPILVYATLIIPTNILFEAALSYLGVGIKPPTASWGEMIARSVPYALSDPLYLAAPGLALVLTVLAFNLLGDGLRDALDPRGGR